jgi:hypothetical protein
MRMGEAIILDQVKKIISLVWGKKWTLKHHVAFLSTAAAGLYMFIPSTDLKVQQDQGQAQIQEQKNSVENNFDFSEHANAIPNAGVSGKNLEWELGPGIVRDRKDGQLTGFYCATPRKNFETSEIWLNEKLKIGDQVTLRISLKKSDNPADFSEVSQEPKIIAIYGKEMMYRFFYPDIDNQRVLFEDASVSNPERRHRKLRYPLIYSPIGETELEFSVQSLQTNRVTFKTSVTYLADVLDENERGQQVSREQITDPFDFEASLPWTNSDNSLEKSFGIGTYPGTCFRILNVKVN